MIVNGAYIIFENHQLFGSLYDHHRTLVWTKVVHFFPHWKNSDISFDITQEMLNLNLETLIYS
jgi:hypothetical protein